MALVEERVSFPVVAGQEQSVAPELVDPPVLLQAHNAVYDRQGELSKRRGWRTYEESIVGASYLPICERLAKRGDELLWIGEQHSTRYQSRLAVGPFSRLPAEAGEDVPATLWSSKATMPRFNVAKLKEIALTNTTERPQHVDTAFAGNFLDAPYSRGVICVVWRYEDSQKIDLAVIDVATRSIIVQQTIESEAYSGTPVRVVALMDSAGKWYFHLFYLKGAFSFGHGDLTQVTIEASKPWISTAPATISTVVSGFDVAVTEPQAPEQRLFLMRTFMPQTYVTGTMFVPGDDGALYLVISTDLNMNAVFNGVPMSLTLQCACDPLGTEIAVHLTVLSPGCAGVPSNVVGSFRAGVSPLQTLVALDDVVLSAYPACTEQSIGGAQIGWAGTSIVSAAVRSDNWWVTYVTNPANPGQIPGLRWATYPARADNQLVADSGSIARYLQPYGRTFNYRGQAYLPTVRGHASDAIVIEFNRLMTRQEAPVHPRATARALAGEIAVSDPGIGSKYLFQYGRNSTVESWYERGRYFSTFVTVSLDGLDYKLTVLDVSAVDDQRFESAEIGGGTYFAGGMPWCYDGGRGHEVGFVHRPQSLDSNDGNILGYAASAGPPYETGGTYFVALCWESVDSLGRVSRSAPSISNEITVLATGQQIGIQFETLGYTSHPNVQIVAYVSRDNGLTYVRSKQVIPHAPGASSEQTVTLLPTMLFQTGMPTLYTSQGILDSAPLPPMRHTCEWQGRLWYANQRDVWYSREVIEGEEPSFNEALSFRIIDDCTGLVSCDDRLIIFTKSAIYWVAGDGPTDTGEGGTFSPPQRLASDFGCINARSIVRTEKGICFQSRRGIELLDRSLATRLISGGVDRVLKESGYSEVVASSFDPEMQIVRFIARKDASNFLVLCWHVLFELWTTAGVPSITPTGDPPRTNSPAGLQHAFGVNWMALNDTAANELAPQCTAVREWRLRERNSYSVFLDGSATAGVWYQMSVETANVKLDGLQGFARCWRGYALVKDTTSNTGIGLSYTIDYSPLFETERTWLTSEDIVSGFTSSSAHARYAVHLDKQQCSAVRFRVRDYQRDDGEDDPAGETQLTMVGFGVEYGRERGTGRGAERSKK